MTLEDKLDVFIEADAERWRVMNSRLGATQFVLMSLVSLMRRHPERLRGFIEGLRHAPERSGDKFDPAFLKELTALTAVLETTLRPRQA